ncbi:uncharacterized protein FIBRA_00097 [Fibroporia radiculosa]|uniref:CSC1/OSCA1-like 7TM region domain-containing protein n=1 Tax=Fibroporia radiculosa TaxID=599839 RepID=J7SCG4_9APHY|nr:uncharacterized protein FIBRA_00097 [Fibroporia radiculosa]CCL98103.1 predicted protein [Fibroporia radiculosa]
MNDPALSTVPRLAPRFQRLDDTDENVPRFRWSTLIGNMDISNESPSSKTDVVDAPSLSPTIPPSASVSTSVLPLESVSTGGATDIDPDTSFKYAPPALPSSVYFNAHFSFDDSTIFSSSATNFLYPRAAAQGQPVCIGDGLDVSAIGVLSTIVLSTVFGSVIWVSAFDLIQVDRPPIRLQVILRFYSTPLSSGIRLEGMVCSTRRPKSLSDSVGAFLFPHVPLIPTLSAQTSRSGKSVARDRDDEYFPSDEELTLRVLWTCVLIISGWAFLGIAGLLPLYLVATPCIAHSISPFQYAGQYSTLQDLSLLRILHLLDGSTNVQDLMVRATVASLDTAPYVRIRLIVLTILAIVLFLWPALWAIMREYNKLVAYRDRWVNERCHGVEMGWLSARRAPGLVGWGEKRLKEFIVKAGLSSSLEVHEKTNGQSKRRRRRTQDWSEAEKDSLGVDIQSLFSVGDTTQLALLIDERDEVLENLEVAEAKYIQSFRLSTPDPSIADFQPPLTAISEEPGSATRPVISRPLPLGSVPARGERSSSGSSNKHSQSRRKRRRGRNPAFGSSSLPPTSYVMPSQYYKLRGVQGLSGGQFADVDKDVLPAARSPSLVDSFNQRVVGSRFQEVDSSSPTVGRIPVGSQVTMSKSGHLVASASDSPVPDIGLWGPNSHNSWDTTEYDTFPYTPWIPHGSQDPILEEFEEDWHDVLNEDPEAFDNGEEYPEDKRKRPRPPRARNGIEAHRESFPLRKRAAPAPEDVPPPHLRLQPRQPFVRPLSGVDHDTLGVIYSEISLWRSKLKVINAEIGEVQRECYNDIAEGARIKGWLMIGRGLRFLPGMQLIEGRAKEDIRWDELQNEGSFARTFGFWTITIPVACMLGVVLVAAAGLFLSTAPDFSHYYPFLGRLNEGNQLGAGIATNLVAALLAILFISLALSVVHYTGQLVRTVSLSGSQLFIFKAVFYVATLAGGAALFTAGALLFAMHSFSDHIGDTLSVADGIIYMSVLAMLMILTVAVVFPGLLLLQPVRLWRVLRAEKEAVTSRQRFRAVYPRTYNPSYVLSCTILAFAYSAAFTLLFPLVAPAALLLLLFTVIAYRFLIGYVYGRTHSSTGGLLQIWLLQRFASLLAFQPLILGLIFLTRALWVEGGILCGFALFVIVFVECYCGWRTRQPSRRLLNPITLDSLDTFARTAQPGKNASMDEESRSLVSSGRNTRLRGSFASILDMMSLTLAVAPSPAETRGAVPLATETLDDLTATERAARTHPDAPPHLPPLPFADHAEEMAGILYAPELLAPPPVIWLPNDTGGIGRSEAYDLERYHHLRVTLDVRAKEDVVSRRSSQARRQGSS